MKKSVLAAGAVLSATMLVTACGSSPNVSSGSTSTRSINASGSSSDSGSITVAAWNDAADSLKAEIAGFNKQYPNIKVTIDYVDTGYQKIMPELASGSNVPDIIQTQARDFSAFLKKFPGEFVDISAEANSVKSDFVSSAWSPVTEDDKVYAMPWDIGPTAVYFRTDIFKKAGVEPSSIKTWDDYIAAAKKVQIANPGTHMWGYGDNDSDPFMMLYSELGGNYVNSAGKIDLTSSQSVQSLGMLQKMNQAGILMDFKDWNGEITAISNNQLATVVYPIWYAGTLMNSVKGQTGKWGVMPLPAFTAGGANEANLGGSVLAITKQSKNLQADWDFLKYSLATKDGEQVMLNYGLFPSYTPMYSDSSFQQSLPYFGSAIYSFFADQSKNILPTNFGPVMLDASKPLQTMEQAALHGTDPASAAREAADSIAKSTGLQTN